MKSFGKLAVLLLAMSLFASPLMACLLPDSTLTDEERECCRQMAGRCGEMPATHSCCKTTVRESDPYLTNARITIPVPSQTFASVLAVSERIGLDRCIALSVPYSAAHAPPGASLPETSILRI